MARLRPRPRILCIHYNPASDGSFVDATIQLLAHLQKDYDCRAMIPGDGAFARDVERAGIRRERRTMTEPDRGLIQYAVAVVRFAWFAWRHRIAAVIVLDYVYWKPAELLALRLLGIPLIAACHFYKNAGDVAGFIRFARRIVVNSERTRQSFAGTPLLDRTEVIYNGIDVGAHRRGKPTLRQDLAIEDVKLVGFVGALKRIKGVEHFIDAMPAIRRAFANAHFIIAGGEHDRGYLSELRGHVERLGLDEHVSFLGHRTDIADVMTSLDLLVVPSLEEPFGFINIEAGIASTPVVASRVGGIPEVIVDGETGLLVPPGDPSALANACVSVLSDESRRIAMGRAGAVRVAELFSMERYVASWSTVVARVLHDKGMNGPAPHSAARLA